MDIKKLFAFLFVALVGLAPACAVDANFAISDVDYDDPVAPGAVMPVTVTLENTDLSKDFEDITVKAWLEDEDGLVGDKYKTDIVQVRQDNEKEISFDIAIPSDFEDGIYTLKITAEGQWEDSSSDVKVSWSGDVEVEQEDDSVAITEFQLSSGRLAAGDSVDAAVTVLNNGQSDEENVKVRTFIGDAEASVSIPLLQEGEEQTVYMTLQMPKDLDAGIQTIKAQAYNSLASVTASKDVVVEAVKVQAQAASQAVTQTFSVQTIPAEKSSVFSLQITNHDANPKTYSFSVGGLNDWASNARVDPTAVTLGAGESGTVQVHLIPTVGGEHAFALFVKDGATTIATQIVKVNVTGAAATAQSFGTTASYVVIGAIVLLALVGFLKGNAGSNGKKRETLYY